LVRDPVAEVLDRRRAASVPFTQAVIGSIALHVALVTAFFMHDSGPREVQRTAVTIRLAGTPLPAGGGIETNRRPAAAPAPRAEAPKPAPPVEKQIETPAVKPTPHSSRDENVFGRNKRPVATPAGPKPSASPALEASGRGTATGAAGSGSAATPAIGTAGVSGFEGGDFRFPAYVERMIQLIGQNWLRPESRTAPLAKVYFEIERDGRIRAGSVKISEESGSALFDRAAKRAVIDTRQLPPLPPQYNGTFLGVHLTFH
jgi:outer membrane biosynthesis protein TonB